MEILTGLCGHLGGISSSVLSW